MATPKMNQDWQRLRDRIKRAWSGVEFDDANLKKTRGGLRRMVSLIQEKTGEPRAEIRQRIAAIM